MLGNSRIRAAIHIDFALYVDLFQLKAMVPIVQLVALLGVPFKFEDILELHFAGLTIVQNHHDLAILLLLLHGLLLVDQQMFLQIRILRVRLGAQWTCVRTNSEMHHLMLLKIGTLRECFITALAFEWFFTSVQHLVLDHVSLLGKSLVTSGTFVWFNSAVQHLMLDHIGLLCECFVAH